MSLPAHPASQSLLAYWVWFLQRSHWSLGTRKSLVYCRPIKGRRGQHTSSNNGPQIRREQRRPVLGMRSHLHMCVFVLVTLMISCTRQQQPTGVCWGDVTEMCYISLWPNNQTHLICLCLGPGPSGSGWREVSQIYRFFSLDCSIFSWSFLSKKKTTQLFLKCQMLEGFHE